MACDEYGQGATPAPRPVVILDVGAGPASVARQFWGERPNVTIETTDIDPETKPTYVHDARERFPEECREAYDTVLMHHVLEHMPIAAVGKVLANVCAVLKPGGYLHLFVPSLEWVAEQVLYADRVSPALPQVIHGSERDEWHTHYSSFTLPILRYLLGEAGLLVIRAERGEFIVESTDAQGQKEHYTCGQNYVVAMKPR
jgi:predicted SAM-dependent methyltransferase